MNTRLSHLLSAACLGIAISLTASAADQRPKITSTVAPTYPWDLIKSDRDGAVLVSFVITASGDVVSPVVVSSTASALEAPVLRSVRKWKFSPGTKDGVPVATSACQFFAFIMAEHDQRAATARLVADLWARHPRGV